MYDLLFSSRRIKKNIWRALFSFFPNVDVQDLVSKRKKKKNISCRKPQEYNILVLVLHFISKQQKKILNRKNG